MERSGELLWKFAAGDPVIDSPVVIEDRVYATTELGGMFCLNAKTGKQIWWAPEVLHFVAAGKQRVYAADKLGRLRILDARNGATLDSLPTSTMPIKISNGQTDRIYLATEGGIIQCLREVEQVNPIVYNESRKPSPDEDRPKSSKRKSREQRGRGAEGCTRSSCLQEVRCQEGRCRRAWRCRPFASPPKPAKGKASRKSKKDVDAGAAATIPLPAHPRLRARRVPMPTPSAAISNPRQAQSKKIPMTTPLAVNSAISIVLNLPAVRGLPATTIVTPCAVARGGWNRL